MDCQKHLFSLPEGHHYINCSYLSPQLKTVQEVGINGIRRKNTPWEITADHFFTDSNRLRTLFSKVINSSSAHNIAILPAVSYGLATVAKNMNPSRGQKIIIAGEQFPSNVYAWRRFCRQHDCELQVIDPPAEFLKRGELWNEQILDAIDSKTLLVALGNVHWADGTLFDLASIGRRARESDAYFVIDGTQSVGALPLDVQKIQPDALVCAGYKWLMGPYSMALGFFGPRLQKGVPLEEGWITRKNSEDFSSLVLYEEDYQPGARRFDVGERSNFILVPMMIEALKQILKWEPAGIQGYCKHLTRELIRKLPEYGYHIEDEKWRGHHMFGIRLPGHIASASLQKNLKSRSIHVSVRGSAVRISPHVYNTERDISVLFKVLKEAGEK